MADQWYYSRGGQQFGPVAREQLQSLFANGTLTPDDLVWAEGMAQWVAGRHVPGLIPPGIAQAAVPGYAAPGSPSGQPLNYAPPDQSRRPTSVTVIAVIGICLGSLAVLGSICGLIVLPMVKNQMASQGQAIPASPTWLLISAILNILAGGLLLASSIAALRLIPWGRTGLLVYAGLIILLMLISTGVNFASVSPQTNSSYHMSFGVGGLIFGMIFPVCILIFMRRPHVVAAFTPGREPL